MRGWGLGQTVVWTMLLMAATVVADEGGKESPRLLFHASFDKDGRADVAAGDGQIYTAESLKREKVQAGLHDAKVRLDPEHGRYGGCLEFMQKSERLVFYRGKANVPATQPGFAGTISFWMQLDPAVDLEPGYVDPFQVTDKKWNDASMFVDFTQENPRLFRYGVFSDYKFWNPDDTPWEEVDEAARPMIEVSDPPFSRQRWTHVVLVFEGFNREDQAGQAVLYLDGQPHGELIRPQHFSWTADDVVLMLGIAYVGRLDDLAVFNFPMTAAQVQSLHELPGGVADWEAPR